MNSVSSVIGGKVGVKFDVEKYRKDFPVLKEKMHGKPLVYLDNAATAQKPQAVIGLFSDWPVILIATE